MGEKTKRLVILFFRERWKTTVVLYIVGLLGAFANVILPVSIGGLLSILNDSTSAKSKLFEWIPFHPTTINSFFIFFAVVLTIRIVSVFIVESQGKWLAEDLVYRLRVEMFQTMAYMKPKDLDKHSSAQSSQRYFNEMTYVKNWLTKVSFGGPIDLCILIFSLFIITSISWVVSLLMISVIGVFGLLTLFFSRYIKEHTKERNTKRAKMMASVLELTQNNLSVKILNREKLAVDEFKETSQEFLESNLPLNNKRALLEAMQPLQIFSIIGIILIYFSYYASEQQASSMVSCVLLVLYSQGPIRRLARIPGIRAQAKLSFNSIEKQLQKEAESLIRNRNLDKTYGLITIDSAFIQPKTTAHVSASSDQMKELYKTFAGLKSGSFNVLLDERSFKIIEPFELRKRIGFVHKDIALLGNTLYQIISYSAEEDRREAAMKMLGRLEVKLGKDELEGSLQEVTKLNGPDIFWNLSLARAFFSNKEIVFLSLPWEELPSSQAVVLSNFINRYKGKRTIIILSRELPESLLIDKKVTL